MKKSILLIASILMISFAFIGCDSSGSSDSGEKGSFRIEAEINDGTNPVTHLTSANKDNANFYVSFEDIASQELMKEVDVEIYFGGTEIGEVDFTENNPQPGYGMEKQLCVPGDDLKSISDYLTSYGKYILKIKAEDPNGKESNQVELTINYAEN